MTGASFCRDSIVGGDPLCWNCWANSTPVSSNALAACKERVILVRGGVCAATRMPSCISCWNSWAICWGVLVSPSRKRAVSKVSSLVEVACCIHGLDGKAFVDRWNTGRSKGLRSLICRLARPVRVTGAQPLKDSTNGNAASTICKHTVRMTIRYIMSIQGRQINHTVQKKSVCEGEKCILRTLTIVTWSDVETYINHVTPFLQGKMWRFALFVPLLLQCTDAFSAPTLHGFGSATIRKVGSSNRIVMQEAARFWKLIVFTEAFLIQV